MMMASGSLQGLVSDKSLHETEACTHVHAALQAHALLLISATDFQ
jgi:hypothetical protein